MAQADGALGAAVGGQPVEFHEHAPGQHETKHPEVFPRLSPIEHSCPASFRLSSEGDLQLRSVHKERSSIPVLVASCADSHSLGRAYNSTFCVTGCQWACNHPRLCSGVTLTYVPS